MKKFIVATDSTSCLDYISPNQTDIDILPLYLFMKEERKKDQVDIRINDFIAWMRDNPKELPYSRPPEESDIDAMIRRWIRAGYEEALFVTLSGAISKTCELIRNVAQRYQSRIKVAVFDSRSQSFSQVLLLLEGKRLLDRGYTLASVVTQLEFVRRRGQMYFTLETLDYLVKNGRIAKRDGRFAKILMLHPILTFDENGYIIAVDKKFRLSNSLNNCLERCARFVNGQPADIFVTHAGDDAGYKFEQSVMRRFEGQKVTSVLVSPVIACHTGPGLYGVGAFLRK